MIPYRLCKIEIKRISIRFLSTKELYDMKDNLFFWYFNYKIVVKIKKNIHLNYYRFIPSKYYNKKHTIFKSLKNDTLASFTY